MDFQGGADGTPSQDTFVVFVGKEKVKLSLFADDVISYVANPKETTKKLLELFHSRRL